MTINEKSASALKTFANPFQFDALDVRTAVDESGNAWFCAKDICQILDITWGGPTLENIPENWKGVLKLHTPGGEQNANFVNIAGLFRLIMRSNKPNAVEFQNWVCGEVLPEIYRTGSFGDLSVKAELDLYKRIDELSQSLVQTKNAFRRKLLLDSLRRVCNIAQQPIPPLDLIGKSIEQDDLFIESGI